MGETHSVWMCVCQETDSKIDTNFTMNLFGGAVGSKECSRGMLRHLSSTAFLLTSTYLEP